MKLIVYLRSQVATVVGLGLGLGLELGVKVRVLGF